MKSDLELTGLVSLVKGVRCIRDSEWLTMPTLVEGDQKFVGLFAVYENDCNLSLKVQGNYTIDWGDGTVENYSSNIQCYHTYVYSNISESTLTSGGYKQVLVTVTPQSGQSLTYINLQVYFSGTLISSQYYNWLEICVSGPSLTGVALQYQRKIDRFSWIGTNSATNFSSMFYKCLSLCYVKIDYTSNVTNFSGMFNNCVSLKYVSYFDTSKGTDFSSMFRGCALLKVVPKFLTSKGIYFGSMFNSCGSLVSIPLFDTSSGTDFSQMFGFCYELKTVPLLNTAKGTNFSQMFYSCYYIEDIPFFDTSLGENFNTMFSSCYALEFVPLLNTVKGINFGSMFSGCISLVSIPLFDTSSGTNFSTMFNGCESLVSCSLMVVSAGTSFSSMFSNCYSLNTGVLSGTAKTISYSNCKLSHAQIVAIFNNLASGVSSQTITITGNPGSSSVTSDDLAIATAKGWTVTN